MKTVSSIDFTYCSANDGRRYGVIHQRLTSGHRCIFVWILLLVLSSFTGLWSATEAELLQTLKTAQKEKKRISETTAYIDLGDLMQQQKDFDKALVYYHLGYDLAVARKDMEDQVFIASLIGNVLDLQGELAEAITWYEEALMKAKKCDAIRYISQIHNNMGNLYMKIGSFAKSLYHYQQALEIKKGQNDKPGIANALMNMSIFYLKTGNNTKTLDYQMQALAIRESLQDRPAIAATLGTIGITYRHQKDYPKAHEYNLRSLKLYTELGNTPKIAAAYNNLGVLYIAQDNFQLAKENYLKAYELKRDSKDTLSLLSTLTNLADVSLKLRQYSECKSYMDKALKLHEGTQYYDMHKTLSKLQTEYYEAVGDYKKALRYFQEFHAISDSLSSVENSKQLSELEVKFELREKERNIELLTKNNALSRQALKDSLKLRNYLYIIIALAMLFLVMVAWRYFSVLKLSRKVKENRDELNVLNQELEKRVESEVERRHLQEEKALRQSRLALLGELAAGIAHELNQPMQTLSLTLENIKLAIQDDGIDQEYLDRKLAYLFEDISRMQDVIEHIRQFSRQTDETRETMFDLQQSIQNAVSMVRDSFAKQKVRIALLPAPMNPAVKGNPVKFEHVILNQLTNARDAILEKMQTDKTTDGTIQLSMQVHESSIVVKVKDNGCGIAPDLHDKIYDIFFTTKTLEKGTGLGLAISLGILKAMNADLELNSELGKGSTFTIKIPI